MPSFDTSLCLIDCEENDPTDVDTNSFVGQLQQISYVYLCLLSYYIPMAYNKQNFFISIVSCFVQQGGEEADDHDEATSNMN